MGTKGGVDLRMEMLPAKLQRAGYKTAIVGKWSVCVCVVLCVCVRTRVEHYLR